MTHKDTVSQDERRGLEVISGFSVSIRLVCVPPGDMTVCTGSVTRQGFQHVQLMGTRAKACLLSVTQGWLLWKVV